MICSFMNVCVELATYTLFCIDMTTWLLVLFFLAPMIVLNRCKWLFHMLLSPPCFPYNCFPHQVRSAWWGSVCSTMHWSPCTMLRRGGKDRSWSGRHPRLSSSSCWSCSVMVSSQLCPPFYLLLFLRMPLISVLLCRLHWWVRICGWPPCWKDCGGTEWKTKQMWCDQPSLWCWCKGDWRLDCQAAPISSGKFVPFL